MGILACFKQEMNQTYSVYPKNTGLDSFDEYLQGFEATATIENQSCGYFTGSAAEALVSDRYKTQISGVIISEVVTVPDGAKIVLSNGLEFTVINADDILLQGEVLAIAVKAVDNGTSIE